MHCQPLNFIPNGSVPENLQTFRSAFTTNVIIILTKFRFFWIHSYLVVHLYICHVNVYYWIKRKTKFGKPKPRTMLLNVKSWMENVCIWPLEQQSNTIFSNTHNALIPLLFSFFFHWIGNLNGKLCIQIIYLFSFYTRNAYYYAVHSAQRWFLHPPNQPLLIGSSVAQVFPSIENRSYIWMKYLVSLSVVL